MNEPSLNRVTVGLSDRLAKTQGALKDHEKLVDNLRTLYSQRSILKDSVVLDQMGELLGFSVCKHENVYERDSRGEHWCPDCRQVV